MSHRASDVIDQEIREIRARWDALKRTTSTGFDAAEDVAKPGHDQVVAKLDQMLETMASQHNVLMATIDLHRRLARLESIELP